MPNAKSHASLPPMASRFVEVAALPWEKMRFAGVEGKTLEEDHETGLVTALMKFAPGARLPDQTEPDNLSAPGRPAPHDLSISLLPGVDRRRTMALMSRREPLLAKKVFHSRFEGA